MSYDRTSFNNGFTSGRQAALDVLKQRVNYLKVSASGHGKKLKREITHLVMELEGVYKIIERIGIPDGE